MKAHRHQQQKQKKTTTPSPPFMPYRPAPECQTISWWINVIYSSLTISLTFSLAEHWHFFRDNGKRRWAVRRLFNNLHRIDTRIPCHIRSQAGEDGDTSRPLAILVAASSVALFSLGLVISTVHFGMISPALVFVSSLVLTGLLYLRVS